MRISGLASGMDVDKMVSDMMKPYKIKVDKAKQEKELVKWKQDSYREVIADLNKFRFTYLDGKGGSKNILNLKAGDVLGVKDIVGNSVTAKISSNKADEGEYTITVNKLAKSAKKVIDIAKDYKQSKDATLTIDLKNGKSPIKIDLVGSGSNADTLDTIANKIVKESKGEVTAKYSEVAGGFIIQNIKTGVESKLEINCTNKDGSVNNDFSKINKENSGENADIIIETPQGKKIIQQNDPSALQENQINIDGINLQLTHEGKTEFKVSKNTDEVYKKVKEFTDEIGRAHV